METTEITNGSTTNGAAITKRTRKASGPGYAIEMADMSTSTLDQLDALDRQRTELHAKLKTELDHHLDSATKIVRTLGIGTDVGILEAAGIVAPKAKAKPMTVKGGRVTPKVKAVAAPKAPKEKAAKAPTERLARRSAEDIQAGVDRIVALLQSKPAMRSEQITAELSLDKRETPGLLKAALKANAISFTGRKRATQYSAR